MMHPVSTMAIAMTLTPGLPALAVGILLGLVWWITRDAPAPPRPAPHPFTTGENP